MKISAYLSEKIKILSFLLTIMIVILHSNMSMLSTGYISFFQLAITAEVTRVAVPLFFLISGFLFFINHNGTLEDYKRKLLSRTHSILIPYIFFLLSGSLIMFVIRQPYNLSAFIEIIKNGILNYPPVFYPLWFLRDLYIIVLFSPLVYLIVKKTPIFIPLLFLIWILGIHLGFYIPSIDSVFFFVLGAFFSIKQKIPEKANSKYAYISLVVWITLCFFNIYIKEHVTQLPSATHRIIILLGIYSIWTFYDKLYPKFSERIKIAPIYKYSFLIYLIHEPILTIIKKSGLYILGRSSYTIGLIYVIAPLLTIWIIYIIGCKLNTYFPSFLSFITGGRVKR